MQFPCLTLLISCQIAWNCDVVQLCGNCYPCFTTSCQSIVKLEAGLDWILQCHVWSGSDDFVVASGRGYTLRNRDSSLSFLVGRCFNIIVYFNLKGLTPYLHLIIWAIVEKVQLLCWMTVLVV